MGGSLAIGPPRAPSSEAGLRGLPPGARVPCDRDAAPPGAPHVDAHCRRAGLAGPEATRHDGAAGPQPDEEDDIQVFRPVKDSGLRISGALHVSQRGGHDAPFSPRGTGRGNKRPLVTRLSAARFGGGFANVLALFSGLASLNPRSRAGLLRSVRNGVGCCARTSLAHSSGSGTPAPSCRNRMRSLGNPALTPAFAGGEWI
jgi:hypothetical protein